MVELPPATFDLNGDLSFEKPIWTRQEGSTVYPFAVLGSLYCDETLNMSVAAMIDGVWGCYDINSPLLPPPNTSARAARQAELGRVDPPSTCAFDEAPLMYNRSRQAWQCVDPTRALIQRVNTRPRPVCNDTDLVVYDENNDWFICKPLALIKFNSTITKTDLRWQVPSTARHIGSIASTLKVSSGDYFFWRWSLLTFMASTESIAYDQSSPPQVVTSGGANWLAYTISTSFVGYSGSAPYYKAVWSPIYPGSPNSYNNNITKTAPGTAVKGSQLTFEPGTVTFAPSGTNTYTAVSPIFRYNTGSAAATGGLVVVPLANVTVDAGSYPVITIIPGTGNNDWYVGTTPDYNPNLILTLAMWLQYVQPTGF
jgi:hypothetical protein